MRYKFLLTLLSLVTIELYTSDLLHASPQKNDILGGNNYGYTASVGRYLVLDPKISFEKQIKGRTNTVFEIRDVFDLKKSTVYLPKGCLLLFKGGALSNGTIIGFESLIDAPNYQVFIDGCKVDGSFTNTFFYADWFENLQEVVDLASSNSGIVHLSARIYKLKETLRLKEGVNLVGCGNEAAFVNGKGTTIRFDGQDPVISLAGSSKNPIKNVCISNLKIRGNGKENSSGSNVGLYIGPKAYYSKFDNISVYGCSNGVEIDNGWNLIFECVNIYYCKNGYYLNKRSGIPLTTTTFTSCCVYNSSIGFNLLSDMNATSLVSCGTDGCETSMELAGCFGVSIISYEFEKHTKYGIHIDNNDCYVTFVGLSPRMVASPSATHIKIEKCGSVTFTDMYISSSVIPREGYSIDVMKKSAPKVVFNNCKIKGKGNNLKECRYVGNY